MPRISITSPRLDCKLDKPDSEKSNEPSLTNWFANEQPQSARKASINHRLKLPDVFKLPTARDLRKNNLKNSPVKLPPLQTIANEELPQLKLAGKPRLKQLLQEKNRVTTHAQYPNDSKPTNSYVANLNNKNKKPETLIIEELIARNNQRKVERNFLKLIDQLDEVADFQTNNGKIEEINPSDFKL